MRTFAVQFGNPDAQTTRMRIVNVALRTMAVVLGLIAGSGHILALFHTSEYGDV